MQINRQDKEMHVYSIHTHTQCIRIKRQHEVFMQVFINNMILFILFKKCLPQGFVIGITFALFYIYC